MIAFEASSEQRMQLEPGQVFGGKYRILRLLGEGGMGAVYEGENVRIHRRVAIKTLHAGIAEKKDTVARFEREAQAAGRIGSEHIVEVLDLGELGDGSRFMVMEFLEGMTLSDRIKSRGRLTPAEACPILLQLLDGLAAAHQAGIIHRDLKPANVFLLHAKGGRPDFVKILDFGVSKFSVLASGEEMSMTRTGAVVGTPYYMSPEQAKGAKEIDPRSDLYAVGVILYECVTGQVPFSADTFNELLFRIVLESPPPAESFVPDLDPVFAGIVRKSMAREPHERFQSAAEMRQVLSDYLASSTVHMTFGRGGGTMVMPGGGALAAAQASTRQALVRPAAGATAPFPVMGGGPPQQQQMLASNGTVMIGGGGPPAPSPLPPPVAPPFGAPQPPQAPPQPMGGFPANGLAPPPIEVSGGGMIPPNAPTPAPGMDEPVTIPKRGGPGIVVLASFLAVVVLGGAAIAVLRLRSGSSTDATAASATAAAESAAPTAAASAPEAPATAEASAAPSDAPTAEPEPTTVAAAAPPEPEPGTETHTTTTHAAAPSTPKHASASTATTHASTPATTAKTAGTSKPAGGKATPAGRKISTEL